ncbi:trichohyalin isoform X1 [Periophthalmus magnuspinnatus]|uniref:trichohyalin isoform X1 n=1 Tax=Periophthalmus magnuspinnatus TaxID=409849 RepID=UPI002436498D|nr:trichohyalin isoform X1 [Periophthalmus magnuspinnatus]
MGTQRPSWSGFDTVPSVNTSDRKLQSGGKIARDPSPRPPRAVQLERAREEEWRRERRRETKERYKDPSERKRYYDKERRPKNSKDEERERRQESRNVRPLSNIEMENAKVGDRGVRKGDTFPRSAGGHGPIMLAVAMEAEREERRRRREESDRERDREKVRERDRERDRERERPKDREDYRRKDERKEARDERTRDRYREYDDRRRGMDGEERRDKYAPRKNDKQRDEMRLRDPRMSSPERRRDRDTYWDKAQRREGRRDTRSEGEIDERERRRERGRERDEVMHQHSRSEGEVRGKRERDYRDQDRYREKEDRPRNRDDRYREERETERRTRPDAANDRQRRRSLDGKRREERNRDNEDYKRERRSSRERTREPDISSQSQSRTMPNPVISRHEWSSDKSKEEMEQLEQSVREKKKKENRKMWLEPRGPASKDSTSLREDREVVERYTGEETEELSVDGELEEIWANRPRSFTGNSEENTEESEEGSDVAWTLDRDRILSGEDGFVTVSSGEDGEEREEEFKDCMEYWVGERDANQAWTKEESTDDSSDTQGTDTPPKFVFCVIGQPDDELTKEVTPAQNKLEHEYDEVRETLEERNISNEQTPLDGIKFRSNSFNEFGTIKRDSQTEKLLLEWRENNSDQKEDEEERLSLIPSNPYADVPIQLPYEQVQSGLEKSGTLTPEEEEAIRIRLSGAWTMSEEPKRHSQAPHLKWATSVVREILGQSDENIDDIEEREKEKQDGGMQIPVIRADDELEMEEESLEMEGLRGMGQVDTHGDLGDAMHADTHTADKQLNTETSNAQVEAKVSDEAKLAEPEQLNSEKEMDTYLSVSNMLYKPSSCPSLTYESDASEKEVFTSSPVKQEKEEEEEEKVEEEEERESLDVVVVGEIKGKSGVDEKKEKGGVGVGGAVNLRSSCSFRDLGTEARFRRRGIRLTRRKEDDVKEQNEEEEEEEEESEGVGRDRRTRIFSTSDDEDGRSKSWGELDLRHVLDNIGKRKRNSKFFKAAQLYQQYSEAAQNFEILRQARSDVVSVCEGHSPPGTSPLPARRPLPPLPNVPHPHSLSNTGSVSSVQNLPLPQPPGHAQRRASSPRLSISLGQSATLWRDLPAVRTDAELQELTEDQRRLQEVRFEVVTSEASYCRSLDIVVEHFVKSKQLGALLTTQDRNWLFSRLSDVRAISHSFLSKLEEKVESDIMHFTVCDVIARHCQRFKMVYVPYLTNQSYQDKTYQRLMNENPGFRRVVEKLERNPVCQRLPLRSFLVLPFQRITRIKLLVQNIVKRTTPGTPQAIQAIKALKLLEKLIQESNDSITQMKSIESLVSLSAKVDFECKTLPLVSQSRILVREGKVTELMDFSVKEQERSLYLHLFNDHLLVSQQKEGGRFTVIDTCPVSELRVENFRIKLHSLQKNVFRLHTSHKSLLLRTDTQSDKLRWISALSRPHPEVDFSTAQDFAQMQCIRGFVSQQPDELSLEKADIILVHQQSSDHWVEGTRLSDRQRGWIPESHLDTISILEIRQRNLSDALKLTTATAQV